MTSYLVEYSPSGRAKCKGCKEAIAKDDLRFASVSSSSAAAGGHEQKFFKHWHCVTAAQLGSVGSTESLDGYEELLPEDQEVVKLALETNSPSPRLAQAPAAAAAAATAASESKSKSETPKETEGGPGSAAVKSLQKTATKPSVAKKAPRKATPRPKRTIKYAPTAGALILGSDSEDELENVRADNHQIC